MDEMMMMVNGLDMSYEELEALGECEWIAEGWKKTENWANKNRRGLIALGFAVGGAALCAIGLGAMLGHAAFASVGTAVKAMALSIGVGATLGGAACFITADAITMKEDK